MNIKEDLKFGQISFNCVSISQFDRGGNSLEKEYIKDAVLFKIKEFILEDFAAKLFSIYEECYMSMPYSITTYQIFRNRYNIENITMKKPQEALINSIKISIDEVVEYCEEYFKKMIPIRFPKDMFLFYKIRSFFGGGEFPFIQTLVLIYNDTIHWAYGISR